MKLSLRLAIQTEFNRKNLPISMIITAEYAGIKCLTDDSQDKI